MGKGEENNYIHNTKPVLTLFMNYFNKYGSFEKTVTVEVEKVDMIKMKPAACTKRNYC